MKPRSNGAGKALARGLAPWRGRLGCSMLAWRVMEWRCWTEGLVPRPWPPHAEPAQKEKARFALLQAQNVRQVPKRDGQAA